MDIERSNHTGSFPEWEEGTVVELFKGNESCGLFHMVFANGRYLINLHTGMWWSNTNDPWGSATHAVVVHGKFVENASCD